MIRSSLFVFGFAALATTGCGPSSSVTVQDSAVASASETGEVNSNLLVGIPVGSSLRTTTSLNLRRGPGTGNAVRLVLPAGAVVLTVNRTDPEGAWFNVSLNGIEGWSHGGYLEIRALAPEPTPSDDTSSFSDTPTSSIGSDREQAIAKAKSGVGFSYWWGHGRWTTGTSTPSYGMCTGSCPNCTHAGSAGADCSGYVAKIWSVPSWNADVTEDAHPYSTVDFTRGKGEWTTIDRASLQGADALTYNTNGAGHIFLYESGDGWGSMWAYEAKGCMYGIVHNIRNASSAYKAISHY